MFAVPIDQSGLAGFVPVRRQSGSSIGLQDLGFDIFGRPIGTGTTDIGSTDIGGTDIGQIEQPVKFSPRIDIDQHGIDPDADPPGIPTEGPEVSFPDFVDAASKGIESLIPDFISRNDETIDDKSKTTKDSKSFFGFDSEKGTLGTVNIGGKSYDVLGKGANLITSGLLATTKAAPFASLFGDMVEGIFSGKGLNATNVAFSLGKAAAAFVAPPLVPVIAIIELFTHIFGQDDVTQEDPFSTEQVMAHSFGRGPFGTEDDDTTENPTDPPDYGGELDIGLDPSEGPFGTDPSTTPSDPGTGADGPGDGDGDGDDGDAGAPGCWVAGTKILMADNTYCNIEDLKIGDMVMSFPETKKTRRWNTPLEPQPIISLLVDVHPEIWHLNDSMVSGTEWIIKGDGTAAIVQWLNIGDTVLGPDNNLIKVTRVEPAEGDLKKQIIYNFETKFNYSYTANNMRTLRGRAVRAPERGPWSEEYLSGDTNAYEGSMQDEYNKKFQKLAA